jgi:hypothetical protein
MPRTHGEENMALISGAVALPENVNKVTVEAVYARMLEYKRQWGERPESSLPWHGRWSARRRSATLTRAINMVLDRHSLMLLYLEKGADILQKMNDEQRVRFKQEGHDEYDRRSGEFMEFQVWREAYRVMDKGDPESIHRASDLYKWVYAAIADYLLGELS